MQHPVLQVAVRGANGTVEPGGDEDAQGRRAVGHDVEETENFGLGVAQGVVRVQVGHEGCPEQFHVEPGDAAPEGRRRAPHDPRSEVDQVRHVVDDDGGTATYSFSLVVG